MNTLFPRLAPLEARKIRSTFLEEPNQFAFDASLLDELLHHRTAFPATGGNRIRLEELMDFRQLCLTTIGNSHDTNFDSFFDLQMGKLLKTFGQSNRSEMGVAEVWDFLALGLLPDLLALRLRSTSGERSSLRGRLTGGDRRHQLQRLWKRRIALGDELVDSQFLTEDDYVQLLERNITLERGALTRRVAHQIVNSGYSGDKRRKYTRTLMKSLLQMSGLVQFSEKDDTHLEAALFVLHTRTVERLEGQSSQY